MEDEEFVRELEGEPSKLDGLWLRRAQLKQELAHWNRMLRESSHWLSLLRLEHPDRDLAEVVRNVQIRRDVVLDELRAAEAEFAGRVGARTDLPEPAHDVPPLDLERIREAIFLAKWLNRVRTQELPPKKAEPPDCPELSFLRWAYELIVYPRQDITGVNATHEATFSFDPFRSNTEGRVDFVGEIDNPEPTDWPFRSEYHTGSVMRACAALVFEVPAPPCDSIVSYVTRTYFHASIDAFGDEPSLAMARLVHEQPNAGQGAPTSVWDFQTRTEGPRWSAPHAYRTEWIYDSRGVDVRGTYFAERGVASRVLIGLELIQSLYAGRLDVAADFSVWNQPGGEPGGEWGLRVNMVPVES